MSIATAFCLWTAIPFAAYIACCTWLWKIRDNTTIKGTPLSAAYAILSAVLGMLPTMALVIIQVAERDNPFDVTGWLMVMGITITIMAIGITPTLLYTRHQKKISNVNG